MRIGIRAKVTALLVFVASLPLAATLTVIVVGASRLQRDSFGKIMLTSAIAEARDLQVQLAKDIEKIETALHEPSLVDALAEYDTPKSIAERARLDAAWAELAESAGPLAEVLNNPIATMLRQIKKGAPRIPELLVTDRFGQLVAATGRTEDYFQADERWWQQTRNEYEPRVFVNEVKYDTSSGVWSADICLPIMRNGEFLGVVKAVLDVAKWIGPTVRPVDEVAGAVMLVRHDGTIIYRPGTAPLQELARSWSGAIAASDKPGWRLTDYGEIQAYARIVLPERIGGYAVKMPVWSVVLHMPESQALGAVYRLSLIVLIVGIGIIGALFLVGLFLVERSIIRRVRRMETATRRVADGDLTQRLSGDWGGKRLLGPDEIDDLAEDLNRMISRVHQSHKELKAANELKMNFIRIAGHELRTPVSYLLGMARLLKDSTDPDRLLHALQTISAKARRLDQIIETMFKLMPAQRYVENLNYSEFDISELLEEVFLYCHPFLERRNQRLIIEPCEDIPPIRADRQKLSDVIENLIMNAIKFTPDGEVSVNVEAEGRSGSEVRLRFAVRDTGVGIPPERQASIFNAFEQADG
ncbi:MAG: sensor histidine kinase, partial [Phycisphaerae bacterium]|nr:sensor histidine kinase [Phycisphaerae bacterium]